MKKKKKIIVLIGVILLGIVLLLVNYKIQSSNETTEPNKITQTDKKEKKEKKEVNKDKKNSEDKETDSKKSDSTESEEDENGQNITEDNNKEVVDNTNSSDQSNVVEQNNNQSVVNSSSSTNVTNEEPKQETNLYIYNDVTGETLFTGHVNYDGSKTLETIMNEQLTNKGVSHRIVAGYLSMMYGLNERDAGPLSGWIFYINGVKSSVGMSGVNPKSGDIIVWKFVEDGVNN